MPLLQPVVVMGVSGSGKSTVGAALAAALGVPFVDGDALHPPENVAKMSDGIPLDDADRAPWLDAIASMLAEGPVVVACSALRHAYRDRLRAGAPALHLVWLHGPRELLEQRLAGRVHEFMAPTLLASQLATLEEPSAEEGAIVLDISRPVDELVAQAVERLESV